MARISCFSREAATKDDLPSRPVFRLPLRPRTPRNDRISPLANVAHEPPAPLEQRPIPEAAQDAMNNAARPRGAGAKPTAQDQIIDLVSDDEDDFIDLREPARRPPVARFVNAPLAADVQNNIAGAIPGPARPDPDYAAFIIEDEDDLDVNDPLLAQFMMEAFQNDQVAGQGAQHVTHPRPDHRHLPQPACVLDPRIHCIDQVIQVFPDVCRDYVSELYATVSHSADALIAHILDKADRGTQYPKAKDTQNKLKRKRVLDEDEEAARKYGSVDRVIPAGAAGLRPFIRNVLSREFPETPMSFLDTALNNSGHRLFSTYRVLEEAHRTFEPDHPPYNKIKYARKMEEKFSEANLDWTMQQMAQEQNMIHEVEILRELQAARRIRKKAEAKQQDKILAEFEEQMNVQKAEAEGTISECGCCFGDFPLNRMIHCDNDILHFFCRACARHNAETEIGNSKYKLVCMSMDGCSAGFSRDQRNQFLDGKTIIALERNEQEAVLRMAGIENLASCPFCPFAAEYPPIEVDREFRCQASDCEKVSCRLCKLESHTPKSCEEHAKDQGLSVRRQIEEAMSAALIRKCNKCGTPFVKEEGCNKMTCTRNGCMNVQCYVCSRSCQYDHFNDTRRGGKIGNCPLFESVEDRHETEVKKAEREALEKVRFDHPEYTEEDLKVKMSENVKNDDERRKANDPRNRILAAGGGVPVVRRVLVLHPGAAPGERPAVPAFPGARDYAFQQDLFADIDGKRAINPRVMAGHRDELPRQILQQGQVGNHQELPSAQPQPHRHPFEQRFPHQFPVPVPVPVPVPLVNQQVPAAIQAGNPQLANHYLPLPPPFQWVGGPVVVGGRIMPDLSYQQPRAPNPAIPPRQIPALHDDGQHFQSVRDRLAHLQGRANDYEQRLRRPSVQDQMYEAQPLPVPWPPNGGINAIVAAATPSPRVRIRHARGGEPFNPPSGQA